MANINYIELFTRIGQFIREVNVDLLLQYPQLLGSAHGVDAISDVYNDRRDLVTGLYNDFEGFADSVAGWISTQITYVDRTLSDLQIALNAPDSSPTTILELLVAAMEEDQYYVENNTATGTITTATGNIGNSQLMVGFLNVEDYADERVLNQTIAVRCDADQHTGTSAGSERFSIVGYPVEPPESYKTQGDGTEGLTTLQANNKISNGYFDDWTDDDPDNWTVELGGTGGTDPNPAVTESTDALIGDSACQFLADGAAEVIEISQNIYSTVIVDTVHAFSVNLKRSAGATGTLNVFIRGTGMSDIVLAAEDVATDIATDYAFYTEFFNLPKNPPSDVELVIQWLDDGTTPLPIGESVLIDNVAIAPSITFGFVQYAMSRGSIDAVRDDNWQVTTVNDNAGVIQTFFSRFYQTMLPSTASAGVGETVSSDEGTLIPDSLAYGVGALGIVQNFTNSYTVLLTDCGKTLVMQTAGKTFTLPSVDAGDVGCTLTFVKANTGTLTIQAADSDTISDSSAGGTIYDDQVLEDWATVSIRLISATEWVIVGADGTWTTT